MTAITEDTIACARQALARPIHLAEGLPGVFYGDAFYDIECRTLFPRAWCVVSVGAAIPNPGDILPIDLAGRPIIVLRDREGSIRAFHNICRHRAIRLVAAPCQAAHRIRCPWHAWTYHLDGTLLATPELGGAGTHAAEGFDKADLGLRPIPVGVWHDYIFVNLDGQAPAFASHVAPLDALVKTLDFSRLRHGGRLDETYAGNWKLSTESGIEDYHLIFGHPQLNAHLMRNTSFLGADGVFTGGVIAMPQAEGDDKADMPALKPLATSDGSAWPGMIVLNVFPTGTVLITPDHVMIGMLLPDGPDRTRVELHFYFDADPGWTEADWQDRAPAREAIDAMWREVLPQDFPFIQGTQATIAARDEAGIRTRFSPYWEKAVRHFQMMVLDAVR